MGVDVTPELKNEIKELIIDTLGFTDVESDDIEDGASLFEKDNPLGLDSIDSLEIVMALQEKYGVRIDDQNLGRVVLKSVNTIAEFIVKERTK